MFELSHTPSYGRVRAALRRYASQALISASPESFYLSSRVIAGCDLVGFSRRIIPIASWGIFNPMGPTFVTVFLAEVPREQQMLVACEVLNPFRTESTVRGLLPQHVASEPKRLMATIQHLFSLNGSEKYPLLDSMPTYVFHLGHSPVPLDNLMDCFYRSTNFVARHDLERDALTLQEFRGNPWQRHPVGDLFGDSMDDNDKMRAVEWPPSHDTFSRWWSTVTNPEHILLEFPHMKVAWEGSIQFQRDIGGDQFLASLPGFDRILPWEDALHRLVRTAKLELG